MSFPPGYRSPLTRDEDATLEDLQFLADTGANGHEAAHRAGFPTRDALEKWLRDHNRSDIFQTLAARDVRLPPDQGFDRTIFYTRRRCAS